ncbi:hypothetical protein LUZ60_007952 [Juncus effusus]|nr:hypothetical protein LUZ60_007952 [Juncus effusus]
MIMKRPLSPATTAAVAGALVIGAFLLSSSFVKFSCTGPPAFTGAHHPDLLGAAVHYATSTVVPQQTHAEISETLSVLSRLAPCNFLVFGLGRDSVLWYALNAGGTTVFLEEDPAWYKLVAKQSPFLKAFSVQYRTHLSEAEELIKGWRKEEACRPEKAYLKGNRRCRLALENLPDVVYDTEWDVIMIDAPKGYFAAAPGRMAAIFSAAVMARARKAEGETHVFLHDVDRRIEKTFAREFLCDKYRVGAVGRLWHFKIPPVAKMGNETADPNIKFC